MQSLKELYKIGNGPSSSHTMGPKRAVEWFKKKNPTADKIDVYLYGSLAFTGKGHLTDKIIEKTLHPIENNIIFDTDFVCSKHPNTMDMVAYKNGEEIARDRVYSVGGGTIEIEGMGTAIVPDIYKLSKFEDIEEYCSKNNIGLQDYVYETEDEDIKEFLKSVWEAMKESIKLGLQVEGVIPGRLQVQRRAKKIYENNRKDEDFTLKRTRELTSYAYAVSENNASGEVIVTAPTCGASGVLPAVLYYIYKQDNFSDEKMIDALAVAGLIGNLVKTNASISGAECGCQAEIGTACAMAAAALAELFEMGIDQIEYAAEVSLEHQLGLTCDPICGLVQIPCIERNAVAANRAMNACNLSYFLTGSRNISYDMVCRAMKETGINLNHRFRETSEGGLAKIYNRKKAFHS